LIIEYLDAMMTH